MFIIFWFIHNLYIDLIRILHRFTRWGNVLTIIWPIRRWVIKVNHNIIKVVTLLSKTYYLLLSPSFLTMVRYLFIWTVFIIFWWWLWLNLVVVVTIIIILFGHDSISIRLSICILTWIVYLHSINYLCLII